MDPYVLRICSLVLIAVSNAAFAGCCGSVGGISFRIPRQAWRDCRQLIFTWLLFSLCLTELTLLAVGFGPIRSNLYGLYDKIQDPIVLVSLANVHSAFLWGIVGVALTSLGLLYWTTLRVHEDFLFVISHVFLTPCAVLCVVVSTSSGWQAQELTGNFLKSSFTKAGIALLMFEFGCGFLVSAMLTAMERGNRQQAARQNDRYG